jgi:hypothetical protein
MVWSCRRPGMPGEFCTSKKLVKHWHRRTRGWRSEGTRQRRSYKLHDHAGWRADRRIVYGERNNYDLGAAA